MKKINAKDFIGKEVEIVIDRALGTKALFIQLIMVMYLM